MPRFSCAVMNLPAASSRWPTAASTPAATYGRHPDGTGESASLLFACAFKLLFPQELLPPVIGVSEPQDLIPAQFSSPSPSAVARRCSHHATNRSEWCQSWGPRLRDGCAV